MKNVVCLFVLIPFTILFSQSSNLYQLLYSGDYETLNSTADSLLLADSTNAELYFIKGLANTYQNNNAQALSHFQTCTTLDSHNVKYQNQLAHTLLANGYQHKAKLAYQKAHKLDTTRTDIRDSLGRLFYKNAQFDSCYNTYSHLVKIDSANAHYYVMLGRCMTKMDSLPQSVEFYNRALGLDSINVDVMLELSRNYFFMDSLQNALTVVEKGIKLDDKNRRLHRLKADVLYKMEEYTWATLSYLDAIANGDNSVELLKKLGFCFFSDKNYEKSIHILNQAAELESDNPIIYYYLALCNKQLKQDRQAINYFDTALMLMFPDYLGSLYINQAECQHNEKEYEAAIKNLRKAERVSQTRDVIYYDLANVYYDYYSDRTIPKMYYEKAARYEFSDEVKEFIEYRIEELGKEIFFNN